MSLSNGIITTLLEEEIDTPSISCPWTKNPEMKWELDEISRIYGTTDIDTYYDTKTGERGIIIHPDDFYFDRQNTHIGLIYIEPIVLKRMRKLKELGI